MGLYKHILLAVDLTEESDQLISKVHQLAENTQADLSVIHVLEPLGFRYAGEVPMDYSAIQKQFDEHAQSKLSKYSQSLNYPVKKSQIVFGHIEHEVRRIAEEDNCDLIVVGCHGRHGVALLLGGSTASGVLHGAKTDVLAMHVHKIDNQDG